jgi:predicted DsbA family dithiol-disulfide isomerase
MIVDVYADTVCPWCRIGKRNLELALEQWAGDTVTIRHQPFFLDASIPPEGADFREHMKAKLGGRTPLEQLFARPTQAGAAVGLKFNFEAITRSPNTLLSHRLIALTPDEKKEPMLDAIYQAYFEEGRDIGNLEVLVALAAEQSLDTETIRAALLSEAAREEVIAAAQNAHEMGITGVPFFVINERYALRGAQPSNVILGALKQVAETAATT